MTSTSFYSSLYIPPVGPGSLCFFCLFPLSIEPHATSFKTFLVLCHQTRWSSSSLCSRSPSSSQTSPEPSSIPKSFLSLVSSSVTVCNLFTSPSTIRDPLVRGRGRLRPSLVFFQRSLICFVVFFPAERNLWIFPATSWPFIRLCCVVYLEQWRLWK